jgi:hypothetical protein
MLIRELLEGKTTGKLSPDQIAAIPNAKLLPQIDQGYGLYRFGLHMASSPEKAQVATVGASGSTPFFVPFTPEEENIINVARKNGGFGPMKSLTKGPSCETTDTHKVSPIVGQRKNKKRKLRK